MAKAKSLFGLWSDFKVSDINRLLREHDVRLVLKKSREWGDQVTVTAHAIEEPVVDTFEQPPGAPETPQEAKS